MPEKRDDPLNVEYETVPALIELLLASVESISLDFDRWGEDHVRGPSLYFVVVTGIHSGTYADPLGDNRWPIETCRVVSNDLDSFVEAASIVGFEHDGAVIVSVDGTVQERMVRIKSLNDTEESELSKDIEYPKWMGTKHLSAIETSSRSEVLAAITLSEVDGRVTVSEDGEFTDFQRDELGGIWNANGQHSAFTE